MQFPPEVEEVEVHWHPWEPTILCLRPVDADAIRDRASALLKEAIVLLTEWRALPQPAQKDEALTVLQLAQRLLGSM